LDLGFSKATEFLNEKNGVKLVDLTKDGADGEYPILAEAQSPDEEEPIVVPEVSVKLEEES
jgi:hypothetical protein